MGNWSTTSAANRAMFFPGFMEVVVQHLKSTGQAFLVWSCQPFWSHSLPFLAMYPVFSSVTPSVKSSRKSSPQSPKLPFVCVVLLGYSTSLLSLPVHSISTVLPWSGLPIAHLDPAQPPQGPSPQDVPFTSIPHSRCKRTAQPCYHPPSQSPSVTLMVSSAEF